MDGREVDNDSPKRDVVEVTYAANWNEGDLYYQIDMYGCDFNWTWCYEGFRKNDAGELIPMQITGDHYAYTLVSLKKYLRKEFSVPRSSTFKETEELLWP